MNLQNKIFTVMITVLIFLIIIFVYTYQSINLLDKNNELMIHDQKVSKTLFKTLSSLQDAETGQRGFVITGKENYLEPFNFGVKESGKLILQLEELLLKNNYSLKKGRIDSLKNLISLKFSELNETILLKRQGEKEQYMKIITGGVGKQIMDDIRDVLSTIEQDNKIVIIEQNKKLRTNVNTTKKLIILGGIYSFFSISILIIISRRDLIKKIKLQKDLLNSKEKAEEISEELKLNINKVVEKNKELEQFSYITSHDLQEPLRTISSFTKLINDEHKDELSEDLKTYINFLSESSDRLRNLITSLLDYTRLGNLKKITPVDCDILIKEILSDLSVSVSESKSKISLVDQLPTITGSKTELRILFQNLLSNAIKFSKKDTLPQIKISFKEDSEKWMFSIQDNGIGMKEKDLKKIFSFFTRLHNKESYEGTGIGLAYCIKVVQNHNGNIWVDSELGKGSTFYFTIPKTII